MIEYPLKHSISPSPPVITTTTTTTVRNTASQHTFLNTYEMFLAPLVLDISPTIDVAQNGFYTYRSALDAVRQAVLPCTTKIWVDLCCFCHQLFIIQYADVVTFKYIQKDKHMLSLAKSQSLSWIYPLCPPG